MFSPWKARVWLFEYVQFPAANFQMTVIRFVVWIPAACAVALAGALWVRDRRRAWPGQCVHCGYNLTGNISGRCPECGREVERAAR
jgi:hypothetical protein